MNESGMQMNDDPHPHGTEPDVTVCSRGVIEKVLFLRTTSAGKQTQREKAQDP